MILVELDGNLANVTNEGDFLEFKNCCPRSSRSPSFLQVLLNISSRFASTVSHGHHGLMNPNETGRMWLYVNAAYSSTFPEVKNDTFFLEHFYKILGVVLLKNKIMTQIKKLSSTKKFQEQIKTRIFFRFILTQINIR